MKRVIVTVAEYLLGFIALAVFASVAFGSGSPSDVRMVFAFKIAAAIAAVELAVLLRRNKPANRLIIGANIWLLAGGAAAFLEQWWWLRGYQVLGEAGLFAAMAVVGVLTLPLPNGFVDAAGPRSTVLWCSVALLGCVGICLALAIHVLGDVKLAAVLPVIGLSWLNRLLRQVVVRSVA